MRVLRPAAAMLSVTALLAIWSGSAMAQQINSQQGADPRRAGGAKLTTEQNTAGDNAVAGDEKQIDDSYQPKGIELGSFLFLPQVEVEERYNSNVFATRNNEKGDFITRIAPEMQLRSRFANHALNFRARADQYLFRRFDNDNHLDASAAVDGRYDFTRTWNATGAFDVFQAYEDRGSPDDVGGLEPTRTYGFNGRTGSRIQLGRMTFSGEAAVGRRMFGDVPVPGGEVDNSDRDRWETELTGRGSYEMFPGYAAVVEMQGNRRQYDRSADRNGIDRSSTGWRAGAGIGVDISQLIRGDFLVGYFKQDYEDPRLRDPSGPGVKSVFNWTPSRMTVVVLSLERSVLETTRRDASGMVHTGGSVLVRHELQRNIIATGSVSAFQDSFEGAGQTNWTYDTRARLVYAFTPELYVGGEVGYRKRTSDVDAAAFDQGVVGLRLGLRM